MVSLYNKSIYTLLSLFLLLFLVPTIALAVEPIPNFPNCLNPQGQLKVLYESGIHGVVGDSNQYQGKDSVYEVTDVTTTQCLCTTTGDGIQTNWWKTGSLTESEINQLKADGWNYVPDGSLWGLQPASYMARNSRFNCNGDSNSSSSSSSSSGGSVSSTNTDSGRGGVESTSTRLGQVLGLATTGNQILIFAYLLFSSAFFIAYRLLSK